MTDQPTRRPQPGDLATVDGLHGKFEALSCDGSLYTLRSKHGVTLRAGCLVVRVAEQQEAEA